jgi:tRNA-specific 2-thiouridylase
MFYTIGQRQGLHIGGKKGKNEQPWYVASKDIKQNILIVVQGQDHPALFKNALSMTRVHWIHRPPELPLHTRAKIRYRQEDQACCIESPTRVQFEQPQRAVTPGQSIVFYHDDICLGGGIIEESDH